MEAGKRKAELLLSKALNEVDNSDTVAPERGVQQHCSIELPTQKRVSREQPRPSRLEAVKQPAGKRVSIQRVSLTQQTMPSSKCSSREGTKRSGRASIEPGRRVSVASSMTLDEVLGEAAQGYSALLVNDKHIDALLLRRTSQSNPPAADSVHKGRPKKTAATAKAAKVLHSRVATRIPGAARRRRSVECDAQAMNTTAVCEPRKRSSSQSGGSPSVSVQYV